MFVGWLSPLDMPPPVLGGLKMEPFSQVYKSDTAFRQAERMVRSQGATILNHRLSSPSEVPSPWASRSWVSETGLTSWWVGGFKGIFNVPSNFG